MASPWAKITKPDVIDLQEIMSEQMAYDLQKKEDAKYCATLHPNETADMSQQITKDNNEDNIPTESDEMIARMLQLQYDKEYDDDLKRTQDKYNGTSKVSISLENYMRTTPNSDDEKTEEIEDIRERQHWDRFDVLERELASIPACGYRNDNGRIVTKHDVTMCGRRNACRLLSFPPEFQTGDGEMFDLKLSNKVFNSLKRHSTKEQTRRHRLNDKKEDNATAEFGLDEYTTLLIYKMVNQDLLESVNGVISIGKEAVILHADTNIDDKPQEVAIKVFKTTLSEFKQRDKYIRDDYRFKDRLGKQTARKTVHLWAEKEMHNLHRLKQAAIPCPDVISLKKHVLVMSFIGTNHKAAPKLKDAQLEKTDYILAYEQCVSGMKSLYENANLIHADLSEYNLLWHDDKCYFIDVSQSVEPSHENAFYFLQRDCNNITNFFTKKGVPNICESEDLFKMITGCYFTDKLKLLELRETFKLKPHLVDRPGMESHYDFDEAWEKSLNDNLNC